MIAAQAKARAALCSAPGVRPLLGSARPTFTYWATHCSSRFRDRIASRGASFAARPGERSDPNRCPDPHTSLRSRATIRGFIDWHAGCTRASQKAERFSSNQRNMDHILLLEDDTQLRSGFVRFLQDRGPFEVTSASSLKEAVRALDARVPQLVITDLELPDGSGLDLISELGARKIVVPVVVVTGHYARFQTQLADSPNLDVLTKPFDADRLLELLRRRLARASEDASASAFSVADYLQLAGMARRSVSLEVKQAGRSIGQISVVDGVPNFAADLEGTGEAAFRRLAMATRCQITCQPLVGELPRKNLSGSLEHMLIDAARECDEASRSVIKAAPAVVATSAPQLPSAPTASVPAPGPAALSPPPLPVRAQRPPMPRPISALTAITQGPQIASQEKLVNANKLSHVNLNQLISAESSLEALARADRQGAVLECAGRMDAETACAVAVMAAREVSEAAAELGLGRPLAFHVSTVAASFYVVQRGDELFVGKGQSNKNPIGILRKVAKSCGAGQ